ncbi:MAG: 1-acyl-sn-glycerol-3-phosphate acyltransferase [Caldilineaceae bacterium]|nr:1-acyl-sn-glycerol-3-phosphate acyltransferase [Caldilineaceae bacterium]
MLKEIMASISRQSLLLVGRILCWLLLDVQVVGKENLPKTHEPLILISNHFSWFDAPLLTVLLPFKPVFLVATESQRKLSVRLFMSIFNGIPIWRGQVDRSAFRHARQVLQQGGVLGVFPEGGINPDLRELVARGQVIMDDGYANTFRQSGQLARPRSGTAMLAVENDARILPVGLLGTERIINDVTDWRRLLHWRRTSITLTIGPAFGPLKIDPTLKGRARRQFLDNTADMIMQRVAELFPPEHRGPYRA